MTMRVDTDMVGLEFCNGHSNLINRPFEECG